MHPILLAYANANMERVRQELPVHLWDDAGIKARWALDALELED